jgi:putative DNA primase/helicase
MTESQGQKSDAGAETEDGEAEALRSDYSRIFRQRINERAFADLESWVQTLIPTAIYQPKTQSYRVLSQDFSRPEQYETLIITPRSVIAYDIHGRRDKRDKRRPTDLVIEYYASINDDIAAALWLAERLGIGEDERQAMGYAGGAPEPDHPTFTKVRQAAQKLKPGDIDGAKRVFDHLMAVRNHTPANDDIICDLVKNGLGPPVTLKSVRALLKAARKRAANAGPDGAKEGGPPRGFLEIDGWMRQQVVTDAGSEWVPICTALTVTAMLRDSASSSWGLVVHFEDADRRPHDVPLPAEVYGDPIALAALMMAEGLRLADATPKTRSALATLLTKWQHPARRTVAATPGWTPDRRAFLFGDGRTIGDQTVVLGHGRRAAAKGPGALGDLSAWTVSVASLCAGNPVLLMSVSAAFAAVMLEILNIESGIVHYRGDSSSGKTTAQRVAMSVWELPTPVPSWRATANGLEGGAAAHNSILFALDELHLISPREAGQAALMLCNGTGKARADQRGEARARKQWTIMVLSSGECSLADRVAAAGETVTAGQEVRFLDLKTDERAFGCFDDLHGEASSKAGANAFAIRLAKVSCAAYGTAGPAFIEFIMRTPDIVSRAEAIMAKFEADADWVHGLADANAQVTRALRRFAVVAAGGELATEAGITGWAAGTAAVAIQEMFGLWVGGRGGLMSAADRNAVANTRAFLIKNDARFHKLLPGNEGELMLSASMLDRSILNLAGWKDAEGYWVSSDAWMKEIHAGVDGRSAARVLRDAGLLVTDRNRGSRLTRRGPRAIDRIQCYFIKRAVLATEQGLKKEEA